MTGRATPDKPEIVEADTFERVTAEPILAPCSMAVPIDGAALTPCLRSRETALLSTTLEDGEQVGILALAPHREGEPGLYVPMRAAGLRAFAVAMLHAADAIDGGRGKQ